MGEARAFDDKGIEITLTRSAGKDGAFVVFVDTNFEPDGSDGGPGLRVLLNDGDIYNDVAYEPVDGAEDREAGVRHFGVSLKEIDYVPE